MHTFIITVSKLNESTRPGSFDEVKHTLRCEADMAASAALDRSYAASVEETVQLHMLQRDGLTEVEIDRLDWAALECGDATMTPQGQVTYRPVFPIYAINIHHDASLSEHGRYVVTVSRDGIPVATRANAFRGQAIRSARKAAREVMRNVDIGRTSCACGDLQNPVRS